MPHPWSGSQLMVRERLRTRSFCFPQGPFVIYLVHAHLFLTWKLSGVIATCAMLEENIGWQRGREQPTAIYQI